MRIGVVLGEGGVVGLNAWVENAEREEKTKRNRSSIGANSIQGAKQGLSMCFSVLRWRISVHYLQALVINGLTGARLVVVTYQVMINIGYMASKCINTYRPSIVDRVLESTEGSPQRQH